MARILLAEDDAGTRDLVKRALELDGHRVVMAEDGNEALAALGQGFELLVADVQMPGLDGIELARRAVTALPGLRLVLMSGYADVLDKARWLEGAHGARLLTKPFAIERIRAEVRAALGS